MKVLITGVTGFVGQNLKEFLNDKIVIGVSRQYSKEGNIINYTNVKEQLSDTKTIVHLAGKAHDLKNTSEDHEYFQVNTELTKKIFNQFLKSSCETFIFLSSVKAVADKVEWVLKENIVPKPITAYGKSKLAAEEYILKRKLPEGKRVYILRPCMIHGPNNKGNLNLLYNFVAKGIPYPFGKYENQRSFVSAENLCFVINELIENNTIPSGIYNIADDAPISTVELVNIIGEVIEKPVKILNLPKFLVKAIARAGDFLPLPINTERLQKLTENYYVSNEKIKNAIDKELPLSVKGGIQKTIRSF